jgi:hypothetical protein
LRYVYNTGHRREDERRIETQGCREREKETLKITNNYIRHVDHRTKKFN